MKQRKCNFVPPLLNESVSNNQMYFHIVFRRFPSFLSMFHCRTSRLIDFVPCVHHTTFSTYPQYNGCRGIVLGGPNPDQQSGNLRHPIRLFDFNGKVLQVKVENLLLCRDLEEWKIERMGMTLMEVIKFINNLGDKDNCHVFAFKLWDEMVELGEIPGT